MSFFKKVWNGITSPFREGAKMAECLASWNSHERLFAGSGRLPVFKKEWWDTWSFKEKWKQIEDWWNALGCIQSILYATFVGIVFGLIIVAIFIGSDVLLDIEDLGLLFTSLFSDFYDVFQMGFDLVQFTLEISFYFIRIFFFELNPIYKIFNAVAASLNMAPILAYIITFQATIVALIPMFAYFVTHVVAPAHKNNPLLFKIYKVLDWPLVTIGKAIKDIFSKYGLAMYEAATLPLRIIIFLLAFITDQLYASIF